VRRLPLLLAPVFATALVATLIAHAGPRGGAAFRTPDAGAACRLAGTSLVCSSLASAGSVALGNPTGARVVFPLPWWDASTPVLRGWHHDAISCHLAGTAILCRNSDTAVRADASGFGVTT